MAAHNNHVFAAGSAPCARVSNFPDTSLFVIDGDLTKLACDAVLVPTARDLGVTKLWIHVLDMPREGIIRNHPPFPDGCRAMPYQPKIHPNGRCPVWLGDIGRSRHKPITDDWYADCLAEFVERVAPVLRATNTRAVPPRVAVNVAGSGWGGLNHDKGLLFRTILPRLEEVAHAFGVDVVLVCWGEQQYAAAQRARAELHSSKTQNGLDSRLVQVAHKLSHRAQEKELALFIGAGVSMGAGLKSWSDLLKHLLEPVEKAADLHRFKALDLRDQAAIVQRRYVSPDAFKAALLRLFDGNEKYALAHGLLASLNTRENVTTNYDTLFEEACTTDRRKCTILPYQPVTDQGRWLLKLHGSIDFPEDIVLTREDFMSLPERAGALFGVVQAMLMTHHMLFIGYSLSDDTFHQVMHEVRKARQGIQGTLGTVLVLHHDHLLEELWGDILEIVPMMETPLSDTPTADDFAIAARRLDQFLDLTCLLSADSASFLLDKSFESMLSDGEVRIANLVHKALEEARKSDGPIAHRVKSLLSQLGPL